jgi:hypothetical protein
VTARTAIGGLVMGEWHDQRHPAWAGCMTQLTCIGGIGMRRRFVSGIRASVAG